MIVLFKIEATLFLITVAGVLFLWMTGKGCDDPKDGKIRDLAFCFARIGAFVAFMLVFCMLITGIWAFL